MPETYEMVEKERDALRAENRYKLRPEIESLTEENKRLQAALEKYGQHDTYITDDGEEYPCPFTRVGGPCKCGFDEALKPTTQKEGIDGSSTR